VRSDYRFTEARMLTDYEALSRRRELNRIVVMREREQAAQLMLADSSKFARPTCKSCGEHLNGEAAKQVLSNPDLEFDCVPCQRGRP
jgi:hypothetical protein